MQQQQYEICFITREEKDADLVKKELDSIGARVLHEQNIGRKKFAYSIKKETAGFYKFIYFELDNKKIGTLVKNLQTELSVLRFLIIKNELDVKKLGKQTKTIQPKKIIEKVKIESVSVQEKEKIIPEHEIIKDEREKITVKKPVAEKTLTKAKKPKQTQEKMKIESKPESEKITKQIDASKDEAERIKKLEEKLDELLKE